MWVLLLNDMRSANIENLQPVFRAETKEALKAFVESQKVPPYKTDGNRVLYHASDAIAGTTTVDHDYKWGKCFKHDGPLEWYNKPYDHDEHRHYVNPGSEEDWVQETRNNYRNQILSIPLL